MQRYDWVSCLHRFVSAPPQKNSSAMDSLRCYEQRARLMMKRTTRAVADSNDGVDYDYYLMKDYWVYAAWQADLLLR